MTIGSGPLRRLIVCADDYGLAPGVSAAIRSLAERGRLSATGAMTSMPHWPEAAGRLRDSPAKIAVGLHFTLTDQPPLGAMARLAPGGRMPGLGRLLAGALTGRLPMAEIRDQLERQLDSFEAHFGRPPDFLDGHQHVHLLPGIAGIVQDAFERRLDPERCWLRDCTDRPQALARRPLPAKAAFVALLGLGPKRSAIRRGIRLNRGFSGFYRGDFAEALPRMLAGAGDGHLLMVHPGLVDEDLLTTDSLTTPREAELAQLGGPRFPEILADAGFTLATGRLPVDGGQAKLANPGG